MRLAVPPALFPLPAGPFTSIVEDDPRLLAAMNLRFPGQLAPQQVHGAIRRNQRFRQAKHVYEKPPVQFRTGRVFVNLVEGEKAPLRNSSNAALAAPTCFAVSVRTSNVGILGMPVTVIVPRPDWVLFATHQCIRSPNVELHHSAKGYSWSGF